MVMKYLSVFGVSLSLLFGGQSVAQAIEAAKSSEPGVSTKAPAFTLLNSKGEKVSLSDYENKKFVVLAFSRAHW